MSSRWELAVALLVGCIVTQLGACGKCSDPPPPRGGYALAIGLNEVDPAQYEGWDGALTGCEPDAEVMLGIAREQGFEADMLLTKDATREAVLKRLDKYAKTLKSGDLLVLSYSGHGGTVPDENGDEEELHAGDLLDETWLLYDGQLIDDELAAAWSKFEKGVRILLFSDSCHSGTVLKFTKSDFDGPAELRVREFEERWRLNRRPRIMNPRAILEQPAVREAIERRPELRDRFRPLEVAPTPSLPTGPVRPAPPAPAPVRPEDDEIEIFENRSVPWQTMVATYEKHKNFYRDIGRAAPKESDLDIVASVILISGCQDDQYSADLGFNGLFTWRLKQVWDGGDFTGDHRAFHAAIREQVLTSNPSQDPNYATAGLGPLPFEKTTPYTLGD